MPRYLKALLGSFLAVCAFAFGYYSFQHSAVTGDDLQAALVTDSETIEKILPGQWNGFNFGDTDNIKFGTIFEKDNTGTWDGGKVIWQISGAFVHLTFPDVRDTPVYSMSYDDRTEEWTVIAFEKKNKLFTLKRPSDDDLFKLCVGDCEQECKIEVKACAKLCEKDDIECRQACENSFETCVDSCIGTKCETKEEVTITENPFGGSVPSCWMIGECVYPGLVYDALDYETALRVRYKNKHPFYQVMWFLSE